MLILDNFKKNQEVLISIVIAEVNNKKSDYSYNMVVKIKDIDSKYYEADRFSITDLPKKNIVYTHLSDSDAYVCFESNKDVYAEVKITANIDVPTDSIQADDLHKLENVLLDIAKDFSVFHGKANDMLNNKNSKLNAFLGLNSKLTITTLFEGLLILGCGYLQYSMLKYYLMNKRN